ncbi:MAG TPA: chloride channel protein [Candidatus Methylacidiphilales bacterium]|jgi:CIC family chloride channel protein|nr:chloride channel protein [Candidatus Methylacidiphilales bacterium]
MVLLRQLLDRFPRRTRPLIESGIYGLAAGLAAVAFEVAIARFYTGTLVLFATWTPLYFALASFGVLVGTALLSGILLAWEPDAAGSGIPQLKLAFWKDFGFVPGRVAWVKFFAGILAVGGGSSLGREGPSVQLAGTLTSNLSGLFGTAKTGRRRACAAGAAAGLAATFNTPLAAIAFVLEEILGDLNSNLLGGVVVAAVLGAFMVHAILGSHPAFALPPVEASTWDGRVLVPFVALLATVIGVLFQRASLGLRNAFRHSRLRLVPAWCRPACGAVLCWAIGVGVFLGYGRLGVFSLGYDDLAGGLNGQLLGIVPFVLLVAKFFATTFSYGSGGCGGVFAPSLFLGAMTGCALEEGARALGLPLTGEDRLLLMIIGMSSCLGAVVRAPFTSILIVFEMTREFSIIPALLVAGILSQALVRRLQPRGFYEQVLEDDGHVLARVVPPRDFREWERYPVSSIANYQPVIVPEITAAAVGTALERFPYLRLVHEGEGRPPAILLRPEAVDALAHAKLPELHTVPTCLRDDLILTAQRRLVESAHGIVLVLDREGGRVIGLVTLHDLLRAQQSFAAQHAE